MRLWRKARKEYADKIKARLKEEAEIKERYPTQPGVSEKQALVTSPTKCTEMAEEKTTMIPQPTNSVEKAINFLREQAAKI